VLLAASQRGVKPHAFMVQAMAACLKDKVRGINSQRPPVQGMEQLLAPRS
jgi:hypothetical protein